MAEFILKKMLRQAGRSEEVEVASAATSTEELGNPVYPMARQELAKHGIGCPGHQARLLTAEDYGHYTRIYGMDKENLKEMMRIFGDDPEGKVHLLMELTGEPREIPDPWYTRNFTAAWKDLHAACTALFEQLHDGADS